MSKEIPIRFGISRQKKVKFVGNSCLRNYLWLGINACVGQVTRANHINNICHHLTCRYPGDCVFDSFFSRLTANLEIQLLICVLKVSTNAPTKWCFAVWLYVIYKLIEFWFKSERRIVLLDAMWQKSDIERHQRCWGGPTSRRV